MFKELNRKVLPTTLVLFIVLLALGLLMLFAAVPGLSAEAEPAAGIDIADMEGRFIESEINFIWEPFAFMGDENATEEDASEMWYMAAIHPIDTMDDYMTAQYIAIAFSGSAMQKASELYYRTNLAWETWNTNDLGASLPVRGVVEKMTGDELQFFNEMLAESGMEAAYTQPLVLHDGSVPGGESSFSMWFLAAAGLAFVVWAAVLLIRALNGHYQADLRRWCAASADPVTAEAQLEEFYASAEVLPGNIRVNDRWVLLMEGMYARLLPVEEILWVYTRQIRHRVYFIPVGTSYGLVFVGRDNKRHTVAIRKKEDAAAAIETLFPLLPDTVFGYDQRYEKLLQVDPAAFAQMAAAQHTPESAPAVSEANVVPAE